MTIATIATVTGELPPIESALLGLIVTLLAHPFIIVLLILVGVALHAWLARPSRAAFGATDPPGPGAGQRRSADLAQRTLLPRAGSASRERDR